MAMVIKHGLLELLDRVGQLRRSLRAKAKRDALENIRNYVAPRVEMLRYPVFLEKGYDIGSGPTEAFCKILTACLKGAAMRPDKPNAEAMMTLVSVDSSHLWKPIGPTNEPPHDHDQEIHPDGQPFQPVRA